MDKIKVINILANEDNDILKIAKENDINFIMIYHKRRLIVPALYLKDIYHIDIFPQLEEISITLKDSLRIYCSSIHFCDIETDTLYVYSKDEDEFMPNNINKIASSIVELTDSQLKILIMITNAINDNLDISEVLCNLDFIDRCELLYIERKFLEAKKVLTNGL